MLSDASGAQLGARVLQIKGKSIDSKSSDDALKQEHRPSMMCIRKLRNFQSICAAVGKDVLSIIGALEEH